MLDRIFLQLLDSDFCRQESIGDPNLFYAVCSRLGVDNVAYMGVNLPKKTDREFYVHNTYSKEWALQYETAKYVSIDPVIRLGMNSIMPIDWSDIGKLNSLQNDFFADARGHRVGNQGLSFPVRGLYNETAVFSITADFSPKEWINFKRERLRELRIIADIIHQNIIQNTLGEHAPPKDVLTLREVECLRWYAEGKTFQDISDLLGVAPRTIRFFLEGARGKLNCLNTTHTVVVALQKGLI